MKQYKTNQGTIVTIYDDNNVFDSGKGYIGKIDQYGTFHAADGSASYSLSGNVITSNDMKNAGTIMGGQIMLNQKSDNNQQSNQGTSGGDFESAVELFKKFIVAPANLISAIMIVFILMFVIAFLICKRMGVDLFDVINNSKILNNIDNWIDAYNTYIEKHYDMLPIIIPVIFFVGSTIIWVIKKFIRKIKRKK